MMLALIPCRGLDLVKDGTSAYTIVVPDEAAAPVRTAAADLQRYLHEISGAALPIVEESRAVNDTPHVWVGPCSALSRVAPELDLNALGPDGIVVKVAGDEVILVGSPPRGTYYAVISLLEDTLGCRWWTSSEQSIPSRPDITLPDNLDRMITPPLRVREAFYRDAFDGPFAAKLKLNGHFQRIGPEYGGHHSIIGWCHTFFQFLPPKTYFESHPDWYSEIDGKRTAERAQLCLTNDAMRREFTRVVLERLRSQPDAGMISVSQNDWGGRCQCAECSALEETEGSPAGPLIHFVNAIAAPVEAAFPDVLVETLAYQYTRKAPQHVRPRQNVVVRLCSIECSYLHPLATSEQNRAFREDIEAWSRIASKLYIWNYVTNFANYLLPHPNLRVLAPNLRFFVDHHAIGVFEQGDSGSAVGDFVRLRAWVLAHLLWNPQRDEQDLINEFLNGYYGPAGTHLRRYLDTLLDSAEASDTYLRCYRSDTAAWLSPEALDRATLVYRQAEEAVSDDPVLAERVRRERLPLDLVWLQRYDAMKRRAERDNRPFLGPDDPKQAVQEFIASAQAHDVGNYREGRPFSQFAETLERQFRDPAPPPEACEDLPEGRWMDIQDHRFKLHGYGNWVTTEEDPAASDGFAARMAGNHHQWAVQIPFTDDLETDGPWQVVVALRCDATAESGPAADVGIYDYNEKRSLMSQTLSTETIAGEAYRVVSLGSHALREGIAVWVAPVNSPERVQAILVDRVYLIRATEP